MSGYQYYEFQAIDRPLTDAEMRRMREVSSRAEITPTRFANSYSWGDFKGSPSEWMKRYFDAFLYLANWGTRELMFRFPIHALDPELARRYCPGDEASAVLAGDFVVLELASREEDGDRWVEEAAGVLGSIVPVRAEVAGGDYRALYLAWLMWAQWGDEVERDVEEPPVPPGLGSLTGAQQAFAEFLRIDPDLIAAAAERSAGAPQGVDVAALRSWIAALADGEKTGFLVRVVEGAGTLVGAELLRRFRATLGSPAAEGTPRTVAQLMAAAEAHADERLRMEKEEAARAKALREREEAAARERHLADLANREEEGWSRADELVSEKKAPSYDQAVRLLADLREIAVRQGRSAEADTRLEALRQRHAAKRSFLERLKTVIGSR